MSEQDNARQEMERLAIARDEWRKTAYQITERANKTRDELTAERDEARAEVERLKRQLEQAISERTPHDYGLLAEQRDQYKQLHFGAIQKLDKARAEVKELKQALHDARLEDSAQAAQLEQAKDHMPDATKMIRPEPSRLEIAAMLQAGWLANAETLIDDNQHEWWLAQADLLIKAAKGGAE
jgi:hypothetical protein